MTAAVRIGSTMVATDDGAKRIASVLIVVTLIAASLMDKRHGGEGLS